DASKEYFTGKSLGKEGSVVWVFVVMLITFLSVVTYLILFHMGRIWEKRREIYFIGFDAIFFVLWITEVFANLYWAYKGSRSPCYYYTHISPAYYGNTKMNSVCGAYIASNVFGWFLLITFILGAGISYKIHLDSKKENSGDNNIQQVQQNQQQQQQYNQYNQQPQYQQPYQQSQYNQPQYNQPQYNQPQYNQPQYNQPQQSQQY
ncbi:12860_t:CDS:2, partial [Acaulospora morrowiae]